ncbi:serine protease [Eubacteriales bacterium OttesenSCG-928-K08]|nr:serine protease [Eubacteriales bacterium OttesenSCG-928-K08]
MKKTYFFTFLLAIFIMIMAFPALANSGASDAVIQARKSVFRVIVSDTDGIYSGSCFIISSDMEGTFLATNFHVVKNEPSSVIGILSHDENILPASIVHYNELYDVCLLKTDEPIENAAPLTIALAEEITIGQAIYALGFPEKADYLMDKFSYHYDEVSLTNGIINSIRSKDYDDATSFSLLQINSVINPGNSGGPLLNESGHVVGINTMGVVGADGIYGAVHVKHLEELLIQSGVLYYLPAEEEPQKTFWDNNMMVLIVGVLITVVGFVLLILDRRRVAPAAADN